MHAGICSLSVPHLPTGVVLSTLVRILYVCGMELKKNGVKGIDDAMYIIFEKATRDLDMLPPIHNALELHIKILNYEA